MVFPNTALKVKGIFGVKTVPSVRFMETELICLFDSQGIWQFLWDLVQEYTRTSINMVVITGPIYDRDGDGLADSHRFVDINKLLVHS